MSPAQAEPPIASESDGPPAAPAAERKPIAVLHVVNGEHYAGAERVQDLLALRLPEQGFRIGFACLKPGRFPDARQSRQTPLYRLPMFSRFDLTAVGRLTRVIRNEAYELLHAHTPRAAMIAHLAARAAGVPMVYHVHSPTWHDSTRRWQDRCNTILERFSLRRAAWLVAVSESLSRQLVERGFDPRRISVVHNGVPRTQPSPYRNPPAGRWTLGAIALWRPRKGIETLLEALAILVAERQPVGLRVVGPFESRAYEIEIKRQAARLGLEPYVEWVGFRRDVPAEMMAMDLFVLPSLFGEGLPMVVLEAMSAGVPVVATRVEGIPEVIGHAEDGVLAEPGNAEDLARAIRSVVAGHVDWSQLRTRALGRQAREFSDESMAAGVAEVYRRVLAAV